MNGKITNLQEKFPKHLGINLFTPFYYEKQKSSKEYYYCFRGKIVSVVFVTVACKFDLSGY